MTGACLLLGFGPLAFGAVQEWAIYALESGASLLIIVWAARELAKGQFGMIPNPLFLPGIAFAAIIAIQLMANRAAYWYVSWQHALLWAAYGMIFFVVSQTFRHRLWIKRLGFVATSYGFLMALFAIIQQFTWNGKVYWVVANSQGGAVYGPYIDRAHYAGLMEMLIPLPLVYAMTTSLSRPLRGLALFAAVIMSSSIFLAQSLGGIIAFGVELMVLTFWMIRRRRSSAVLVLIVLFCVSLGIWLVGLHPTGLGDRLAQLQNPLREGSIPGRLAIVKDSIQMVRQRPFLGWGLGNFPVVYPSFRSFYTDFWINEAHNDFVQILVETGIVGFSIAVFALMRMYKSALLNAQNWRHDLQAGTCLAAITGCTGLLAHGFYDFNLQIPANAALFFALAALATQQRRFGRLKEEPKTT